MQVEKYLKLHQPVIYKTFLKAIEEDRLSHAYLIAGNPGTPLKEVATFLAKSIVCDDRSPLACNNCITCLRIDDNNYPDFVFIDGSKESIKKNDISSIEEQFNKAAFESKGIMIYVLHLVENMTEEAINSILKFLEEPHRNVFAFLTTNNENKILPTIISRCQMMHLKLIDRREVINDAIELGVEPIDAELLSYFYNDSELIYDVISNEDKKELYCTQKELLLGLLEELNNKDKKAAVFYVQNKVAPLVNTKESLRIFLDLLIQAFEDLLNIQNNRDIQLKSCDTILHELSEKIGDVHHSIIEILKQRNLINLNLNSGLQLDHLIFEITKEQ